MNKIIVIVGPTGVGKTKLSIELAKKYDGEIINGDAIQIYKGLDIGSAKVTEEEKEGIIHHLFDIKEVSEEYSIYNYQKDCRKIIEDILLREKTPIIVGGTGLYIKSALFDYELSEENTVNDTYDGLSTEMLYNRLINIDKKIDIDRFNRRRVIRALNYYLNNGRSISENDSGNKLLYDCLFIGLTSDRDILYERINKRVDKMIEDGLLQEVKSFYDKNMRYKPLLNGIGYKELYSYYDGEITIDEAINLIKRNSRRYAKRQYTFFNHQIDTKWFNVNFVDFNKTIMDIQNYLDNNN
ncbi:MAG: tRNA (adenosine(37)-N6)-dimethylallyltransferase MiaA [Bacilli bacterium]|nr:tRNA (adenosine(37)-N6)-dimethylallyltransferase MiaA [Bacilli bacterium]